MSTTMGGETTVGDHDPTAEYKEKIINLANRADHHFHLTEKYEATKQYAADHPMVTAAGLITLLLCSFPVMCFGAFMIASLFCTFMGFLLIEGFLLTIGGIFLGAALVITGALSLVICFMLASAFLFVHFGNKIFQKFVPRKQNTSAGQENKPETLYTGLPNGNREHFNKEEQEADSSDDNVDSGKEQEGHM